MKKIIYMFVGVLSFMMASCGGGAKTDATTNSNDTVVVVNDSVVADTAEVAVGMNADSI